MIEYLVHEDTLPEGYHKALSLLHYHGVEISCNDWEQTQKELSMTIVINNPFQEPMISKLFIGGHLELQQYVMEILDGILDFEIQKGNWMYTYHDRMINFNGFNQIDFVIHELKRNPDSRRAVMSIRDHRVDATNSEPSCLQHIQFLIRNNKLHCKILMRSNDAPKATFMNMFAFVMLQKRIADELEIDVGSYTHRANSFHVYKRDYKLLKGYINYIENNNEQDSTYNYEEFYKDLMEESIKEINEKIEKLKGEKR